MPPERVQHLIRVWTAEVENAERLTRKANGLVSALALLFGLGLFKLDWTMSKSDTARIESVVSLILVKGFLVVALASFSFGLFLALRSIRLPAKRLRVGRTASDLLRFDNQTLEELPTTSDSANELVFSRYVDAINELRAQNRERRTRITQTEGFFLFGLTTAMLAIAIYLIKSYPPMI